VVQYVATLKGLTPNGNSALRRSLTPKVNKVIAAGLKKSGIINSNKELTTANADSCVIEWHFDLKGLSAMAFTGKGGFIWWKENMEKKMRHFDYAEEVINGTDYTIEWRDTQ